MTDTKVETWIYNQKGESQLVHLGAGEQPPKGWSFAPPSGVELVVEGASASSPATPVNTPGSSEARLFMVEQKVVALEGKLADVMTILEAMKPAAPVEPKTAASPEREALVARAKELKLEFHHRTGDDKLRAMIEEAEKAQAKEPDAQ